MNNSSRILAATRFFFLLGLTIWIGGLTLIGVAAPAMFGLNRLLGPRAVAAILERFSPVTLVCGVVLLLCWLLERRVSNVRNRASSVQGACIFGMLLLGSYLALVAEPRIKALQPPLLQTVLQSETVKSAAGVRSVNPTKVTIEAGRFASPQARAEFRKLHGVYGGLTSLVVLLGIIVLAIQSARPSPIEYSIRE